MRSKIILSITAAAGLLLAIAVHMTRTRRGATPELLRSQRTTRDNAIMARRSAPFAAWMTHADPTAPDSGSSAPTAGPEWTDRAVDAMTCLRRTQTDSDREVA